MYSDDTFSSGLFQQSSGYKPFRYPWAFEAYKQQRAMHWIPEEISLTEDIRDWHDLLTESERHVITQIFRFFTQGDIDIAQAYVERYIPIFKPTEIRMMLTQFASMESLHIHAYSLLLDTIGMPEVEYEAFNNYKAMADKHDFYASANIPKGLSHLQGIAYQLAVFSAFGEGMQLFSSFAILLSFSKPGFQMMQKMKNIIKWSIRDESLHVESMIKVFHTLVDENPKIWTEELKAAIYEACRQMVMLEDTFIDLCFELGDIRTITKDETHTYVRHIADRRLLQLGLKPNYGVKHNPLPWIEQIMGHDIFGNFFETEITEYASGSLQGDWQDIYSKNLFDKNKLVNYFQKR